jgi:hypothetical protein
MKHRRGNAIQISPKESAFGLVHFSVVMAERGGAAKRSRQVRRFLELVGPRQEAGLLKPHAVVQVKVKTSVTSMFLGWLENPREATSEASWIRAIAPLELKEVPPAAPHAGVWCSCGFPRLAMS